MPKILSRPKKRVMPKKAQSVERRRIVLVGTYAARQLEKWPGYYNYPLYGRDVEALVSHARMHEEGVTDYE